MRTLFCCRVSLVVVTMTIGLLVLLTFPNNLLNDQPSSAESVTSNFKRNTAPHFMHRKILSNGAETLEPNRIMGPKCSKDSIVIEQAQTTPLPNGIPTYTAQIMNVCTNTGCKVADIHLSCVWFSSAQLVNPKIFRRLKHNDCLVNDGRPVACGSSIYFQYANTFIYPLSVTPLFAYPSIRSCC